MACQLAPVRTRAHRYRSVLVGKAGVAPTLREPNSRTILDRPTRVVKSLRTVFTRAIYYTTSQVEAPGIEPGSRGSFCCNVYMLSRGYLPLLTGAPPQRGSSGLRKQRLNQRCQFEVS